MDFRIGRGCGGRRGGRPIANAEVLGVMQQLTTRLEAMELRNQGNGDDGDASEPEVESPKEEEHTVITPEMRFLKSVLRSSSRPRPEICTYQGSFNHEELIDWINEMEKFFDCEEMDE